MPGPQVPAGAGGPNAGAPGVGSGRLPANEILINPARRVEATPRLQHPWTPPLMFKQPPAAVFLFRSRVQRDKDRERGGVGGSSHITP